MSGLLLDLDGFTGARSGCVQCHRYLGITGFGFGAVALVLLVRLHLLTKPPFKIRAALSKALIGAP